MALWVKASAAKTGSQSWIPEMVEAKMTPLKLMGHGLSAINVKIIKRTQCTQE